MPWLLVQLSAYDLDPFHTGPCVELRSPMYPLRCAYARWTQKIKHV